MKPAIWYFLPADFRRFQCTAPLTRPTSGASGGACFLVVFSRCYVLWLVGSPSMTSHTGSHFAGSFSNRLYFDFCVSPFFRFGWRSIVILYLQPRDTPRMNFIMLSYHIISYDGISLYHTIKLHMVYHIVSQNSHVLSYHTKS